MPEGRFPLVSITITLLSVSLHEFGHAKSADSAGDPTPRSQGRVTLNPLAHLDPLGTLMIVLTSLTGFGIGWGKPVMVNPRYMQHPRIDHFLSVLWGPLTNFILAIVFAIGFRYVAIPSGNETFIYVCWFGTFVNIGLCLFNLIPLGPLDGHWLLAALLPERLGLRFGIWSRTYGTLILFSIILVDGFLSNMMDRPSILSFVLRDPVRRLGTLLLGT